jgi:hypothetical protein
MPMPAELGYGAYMAVDPQTRLLEGFPSLGLLLDLFLFHHFHRSCPHQADFCLQLLITAFKPMIESNQAVLHCGSLPAG